MRRSIVSPAIDKPSVLEYRVLCEEQCLPRRSGRLPHGRARGRVPRGVAPPGPGALEGQHDHLPDRGRTRRAAFGPDHAQRADDRGGASPGGAHRAPSGGARRGAGRDRGCGGARARTPEAERPGGCDAGHPARAPRRVPCQPSRGRDRDRGGEPARRYRGGGVRCRHPLRRRRGEGHGVHPDRPADAAARPGGGPGLPRAGRVSGGSRGPGPPRWYPLPPAGGTFPALDPARRPPDGQRRAGRAPRPERGRP